MKKIIAVLCILCLAACQEKPNETKTTVCEGEINGVSITNTYEYEDDKILKQTSVNVMDLKGIDEDMVLNSVEQFKESISGIKGISYEYTIENQVLNEKVIIDYTQTSMKELLDSNLVTGEENAAYVSYEQTIEGQKEAGFTCK